MIRGITVLLVMLLAACQNAPTEFALVGDSPYSEDNVPRYERMIERINATPRIAWVVHLGDMKSGIGNCRDEDFEWLHELNGKFTAPFVLTPGDNDWFDCRRDAAGGWDRLDRLDKLREVFYARQPSLPLVSQADSPTFGDYVENVYWLDSGVLFATVHLVGITGTEGGIDLHNDVQNAAVEWLGRVFAAATENNVAGIFLASQADMYPFTGDRGWLAAECPRCAVVRPYYEKFHEALLKHARQYKKPILLAVGDTHIFRVDKPLYDEGELMTHVTRVEGFGEDTIHWVRIVVHPEAPDVFEIHQEIVPENIR